MIKISSELILNCLKWILNSILIIYLILFISLIIFGGFRFELFGLVISVYSLVQLLSILIVFSLIRITIGIGFPNAILMWIALLIGLIVTEGFLRILDLPLASQPALSQWRKPSDTLGWKLIPSLRGKGNLGTNIKINSHGLRDIERSWDKPDGKFRILTLGDSFTYGDGVELNNTYAKLLENFLTADGLDIDVINAGVIGYNLYQSLIYFKTIGFKYDPDLIIYFFWIDDIGGANTAEKLREVKERLAAKQQTDYKIIEKSNLYVLNLISNTKELLDRLLRPFTGADWLKSIENRQKYLEKLHDSRLSNADDLVIFKHHLNELNTLSKKNSAKLLIVLIPDAAQLNNPHLQKSNSLLKYYCAQQKIPILDITEVFEGQQNISSLYLFPLDAHTSAMGNNLIVKEVYKKIYAEDLIK